MESLVAEDGDEVVGASGNMSLTMLEEIARNCSLRFEHIEALNTSDMDLLMRLYNMCEHTWDPEKTWDVYYWEELLPPLVVYSLTFLLGIVGNLLIIFGIIGHRRMKTPTNIFLASLAFADLLLCIICIPVKLAQLFSFTWTFGFFLCKFVNYMQNVSAIASVLNLTVMSLERCYAIVYPMKAKSVCTVSKANKVVGLVWIFSFLLATPTLYIQIHMEVGLVQKGYWCVRDTQSPLAWRLHEIYSLFVLLLLPGGLMTAAYGLIAKEICRCMRERAYFIAGATSNPEMAGDDFELQVMEKKRKQVRPARLKLRCKAMGKTQIDFASELDQRLANEETGTSIINATEDQQSESSSNSSSRRGHFNNGSPAGETSMKAGPGGCNEAWIPINAGYKVQKQSLKKFKRVIRMLVVIIVVFVMCWTPYLIFNIIQSFGLVSSQMTGVVKYLKSSFTLMAYLNSALNPIIYGFMCRSFRENFFNSVGSCCGIRPSREERVNNTQPSQGGNRVPNEVNGLRINRSRGTAGTGYANYKVGNNTYVGQSSSSTSGLRGQGQSVSHI